MAQMRSRREQVEAHKFITSRMNQALVLANPDSIERPLRRIGVSIFASVMVLALIFGGFAIATLFGKGNAEPVVGNIITIKGSNAVYVYITQNGEEHHPTDNPARLWQVTNYTSALLLAKPGSTGMPEVQDLKPSSLAGVPRGSFTIGIQGIPSQPPDKSELLQKINWNVCSMPREDGGTDDYQLTQLVVEDMEQPSEWLSDDKWILAKTTVKPQSDEVPKYYLLWNGARYPIEDTEEYPAATLIDDLGLLASDAMTLNASMINTIPPASPMAPEDRTEFGTASQVAAAGGGTITYGVPVESSGEKYVLINENGADTFARISDTMAKLLEKHNGATQQVDPTTVSDLGSQAAYEHKNYPKEDLSENPWTSQSKRPAVCAVYDPRAQNDESTVIKVAMYEAAPKTLTDNAKAVEVLKDGTIFSDVEGLQAQTVLPQGTAALVDSRTDRGATISGITYMVSDQGVRHGISDDGKTDTTQTMLGYAGVDPVSVPDTMIHLIPKGPDLDPFEAKKQMTSNAEDVPVFETAPAEEEGAGG
ncbi:type VII secretion protein EccB [Glycomyces luteolus]|uniref:Type VII secretion protein EccB n=1 Tax=Glycomyces luteolus TaxID=2670330 RepID=A0A9X3PC82_9ACTN|nr:type VII secretion protein EccB [Glycomyces luteolus]MDA1362437.1 type VII secretion protein EccB [Glycomyces luteolus]